jgi:hypothetical protein
VTLPPSRGASRLAASATLSDGRTLGYDLATTCRQLLVASVPLGVGARVVVSGVRYDLETGPGRSVTIAPDAATAGPKGMIPRRLWKPVETCR